MFSRLITVLIIVVTCSSCNNLPAANPVLKHCLVSAKEDVQVPAMESGMLTAVPVQRGAAVEKDTLLAQIDDSLIRFQEQVALVQWNVAHEEAENDVNWRYSKKAAEVAEKEYQRLSEAEERLPGSISKTEIDRARLAAERAVLQIEQSVMDSKLAKFTTKAKLAELYAARRNLEMRKINAPFAGQVEELFKQRGEWVQAGEPVARVIRLDRLKVKGFVNARDYNPGQIAGRGVEVVVELARGQTETFQGKIAFVSSQLQAGGDYQVAADVLNKKDQNGYWLLRPGAVATMTIRIE
jgi:multidrug efflux pump subunit AcrA (membrane-fusion protein)